MKKKTKSSKTSTKKKAVKRARKIILPMVMSELLRIAVEDCKKVERMKNARSFNMGVFIQNVSTDDNKRCEVCMAGAVMDRRLHATTLKKFKMEDELWLDDMPGNQNQLAAIDLMRNFELHQAACELGTQLSSVKNGYLGVLESEFGPKYDGELSRASWDTYLELADHLKEIGL